MPLHLIVLITLSFAVLSLCNVNTIYAKSESGTKNNWTLTLTAPDEIQKGKDFSVTLSLKHSKGANAGIAETVTVSIKIVEVDLIKNDTLATDTVKFEGTADSQPSVEINGRSITIPGAKAKDGWKDLELRAEVSISSNITRGIADAVFKTSIETKVVKVTVKKAGK